MSKKSPCWTCERVNEDKNKCAPICKRLVAFINGLDWRTEDIPRPEELGEAQSESQQGSTIEPGPISAKRSKRLPPQKGKTCEFPGCDLPHKSRGLCSKHHSQWMAGKLPGWPPYKVIMPQMKRKQKKGPKKKSAPRKRPLRVIETLPESQLIIDLSRYPRLRDIIFSTATKLYVTPEHVIISLAGEAISRRQNGHS